MNYRNERLTRGFRSLDAMLDGFDPSKFLPLSDCGVGARQIRRGTEEDDACADLPGEESPEAALDAAAWDAACADPMSEASPEAALDAAAWDEACAVWDEACAYPPSGASREAGSTRGARPPYHERCIAEARRRLTEARRRLTKAGLARLLPVLDQIVLNGKNRRESIRSLAVTWRIRVSSARVKYYRGVAKLTKLFSPNKIKGETDIEKC